MRGTRPVILQDGSDVLLAVRVQPRASRNQLIFACGRPDDLPPEGITLRLTAPPVEGAANTACCGFLAQVLGITQSRITIERGEKTRRKLLRVHDADVATVFARLQSAK